MAAPVESAFCEERTFVAALFQGDLVLSAKRWRPLGALAVRKEPSREKDTRSNPFEGIH